MKTGRKTKVFDYERVEVRAFINKKLLDETKRIVEERTSLNLPQTQIFSFALNEFVKNHYRFGRWKHKNNTEERLKKREGLEDACHEENYDK